MLFLNVNVRILALVISVRDIVKKTTWIKLINEVSDFSKQLWWTNVFYISSLYMHLCSTGEMDRTSCFPLIFLTRLNNIAIQVTAQMAFL